MRRLLLAVFLVAACGSAGGNGSSLAPPSPPGGVLAAWKDFPANAHPRPIVIFNRALEHIGPAGFSAEPDRKLDWFCNKFVFAPGVGTSTGSPGAATAQGASYRSIGSSRAYSELMAQRSPSSRQPNCSTSLPFVIKDVRWSTAGFPTDRGTMTMSAWIFDIGEVEAYLAYAGLAPSSFWRRAVQVEGRGAGLTDGGRTLKIAVGNAGPGPCGSDYTAAAAESDSAVAVAVKQYSHATPGTEVACPLYLRVSYISLTLKAPLGGRVLLDEKGNVGAVG